MKNSWCQLLNYSVVLNCVLLRVASKKNPTHTILSNKYPSILPIKMHRIEVVQMCVIHVSILIHPPICMNSNLNLQIAEVCADDEWANGKKSRSIFKEWTQFTYVLACAFINIYKESRWNAHRASTHTLTVLILGSHLIHFVYLL